MKKIITLSCMMFLALASKSQLNSRQFEHPKHLAISKGQADPRNDSVDILKYTIKLNITDFTNKAISGSTEILIKSKINSLQSIQLDLLKLSIDSIKYQNTSVNYSYNDTLIKIKFPSSLALNDSAILKVYYKGKPQGDATGWGGFYFSGSYAYNLGVGFGANPHVYGRVWFPCFDNFVQRSKYEFQISTDGGKIAYCNGSLINDQTSNGIRTRTWVLNEEIPTYLASVAVGLYTDLKMDLQGIERKIPILIASLASDTNLVKTGFSNLSNAISAYENDFGAYSWNRVGYALVPFTNGAMEHATNIAYPKSFAITKTYETIMAHELSHHWFGDLITCSTQEDMWLNEGWASYCESIFLEKVYGKTAYKNNIRKTHSDLLMTLINSEGRLSLDCIPFDFTYGNHVYLKGAMVAHSLRGYLGDSLFFASITTYLNQHKFQSISSKEFEQGLSQISGVDLSYFFRDWVSQPGWADFQMDGFTSSGSNGNFSINVNIKQKTYSTNHLYDQVPLSVTVIDDAFNKYTHKVMMTGLAKQFQFNSPISAKNIILNFEEELTLAQVSQFNSIKNTGNYNNALSRMIITVSTVSDSAWVHTTHHFTGPDAINQAGFAYRVSPNRFWDVNEIHQGDFVASAKIIYDGRSATSPLDFALNINHEDSLTLLYRKDAQSNWVIYPHYTKDMGNNKTDKYGSIVIDSLKSGQYAFGMGSPITTYIQNKKLPESSIQLYPNPSNNFLVIECNEGDENLLQSYNIIDISGKLIIEGECNNKRTEKINLQTLPSGSYLININTTQGNIIKKFTVK